jgi:hypothetical protein
MHTAVCLLPMCISWWHTVVGAVRVEGVRVGTRDTALGCCFRGRLVEGSGTGPAGGNPASERSGTGAAAVCYSEQRACDKRRERRRQCSPAGVVLPLHPLHTSIDHRYTHRKTLHARGTYARRRAAARARAYREGDGLESPLRGRHSRHGRGCDLDLEQPHSLRFFAS